MSRPPWAGGGDWLAENEMKMPDIYHNWRAMLGVALIVLGTGNWLVGRHNTEHYGELIRSAGSSIPDQAYRSFG